MKTNPHPRSAFTLIETAVALGVIGFCLEAILGLLPIGISSENASIQQTRTAGIASAIASDLQATPINLTSVTGTTSQVFRLTIPPPSSTAPAPQTVFLSRDGNLSSTSTPGAIVTSGSTVSIYRATVTFTPPAASSRSATTVRIFVTYPALADQNGNNPPVNYEGYFETFTSLNRN